MTLPPGEGGAEAAPEAGTSRRVARGFLTLAGGRAVALALQVVSFAVLAAYLQPAGLGVYAFAIALAGLFLLAPNFGLQPVLTRDISVQRDREGELVANAVYLRFALALVAYALLAATVTVVDYPEENRRAALAAGSLLFLAALDSFRAVLEVRLRMAPAALFDIVEAVALLAGILVLERANAGVLAFVWLYVAVNAVNAVLVAVYAARLTELRWRPQPALWRPAVRSAWPVGLASLFGIVYYRMDVVLLARLRTAEDVGQYSAAYRFLESSLVLSPLVMAVLSPVLARSFKAGTEILQHRFGRVMHLLTVAVLPVAIGGALSGWRLLPQIPGFSRYAEAGVCLSILAPAVSMIVLATAVQGTLIVGYAERVLLRIAATAAVVNIALNLVLIPPFGAVGAAVATTATEALVLAASVRAVRRRVELRWPERSLVRVAPAALAMVVAGLVSYPLPAVVQLLVAAAAYVVTAGLTGAVRWSEIAGVLARGTGTVTVLAGAASAPAQLPAGEPALVAGRDRRRTLWRALTRADTCVIVVAGPAPPVSLPLLARVAGCRRIRICGRRADLLAPGVGRVRRLLLDRVWGATVDDVALDGEDDDLPARLPRLASIAGRRAS